MKKKQTNRQLSFIMRTATVAGMTTVSVYGGSVSPIITPESSPDSSPWEFLIEPYAWLTALEGDVGILNRTGSVDAGFDDIADVLEMAAALKLDLRHGRWGFIADGFYADLSHSFTPRSILHTDGEFEMQQFLGEFYAAYRFVEKPEGFLDVCAGIRYNYLSNEISAEATFPLVDDIDVSASKHWIDPIIGLRGQWDINQKWFLAGEADIGGFSVSSDLTWSVQATAGYRFTENVFTELGYRYLSTDYKDGGFTYDMNQSGLYTGVSIKF